MGLHYFIEHIQKIIEIRPNILIKAFTAVELEYMCRKDRRVFILILIGAAYPL